MGHGEGQFVGTAGRLAEPERNTRRRFPRIDHAHKPVADLNDLPGFVGQLEYVAGHALNGVVFIERADERVAWLKNDVIVEQVGNGAAVHDGGQPRPAPRAKLLVHRIVVQIRPAAPASMGESIRQHGDDVVEFPARHIPVRIGPPHPIEEFAFAGRFHRHLGDDLLGEDVQGFLRNDQTIELPATDSVHHGRAFHEFIPAQREKAAFGRAGDGVARTADPLEERGDGFRRTQLTDEIDRSNVDTQFEGGRRHQCAQASGFEPLFGVEAMVF